MTVSGRKGESVYLRGWDDYERHSLKLTACKTSGIEHNAHFFGERRLHRDRPAQARHPADFLPLRL
jgi:hypothetical protein